VKPGAHGSDGLNPAVPGQQGIERSLQCVMGPTGRSVEAHCLAGGMNARVGASGGVGYRSTSEEAFKNTLEFSLYRATGRLPLPPNEAGAVIVQRGEEGPAHRPEFSRFRGSGASRNCLSGLTKASLLEYNFDLPPYRARPFAAGLTP
jgi:hypothetical protein